MKLLHPVKVSKCMKEPTLEINLSTVTSKKAFASCEDLRVHEITHNGEKPLNWHDGNRAFLSSEDLKVH